MRVTACTFVQPDRALRLASFALRPVHRREMFCAKFSWVCFSKRTFGWQAIESLGENAWIFVRPPLDEREDGFSQERESRYCSEEKRSPAFLTASLTGSMSPL